MYIQSIFYLYIQNISKGEGNILSYNFRFCRLSRPRSIDGGTCDSENAPKRKEPTPTLRQRRASQSIESMEGGERRLGAEARGEERARSARDRTRGLRRRVGRVSWVATVGHVCRSLSVSGKRVRGWWWWLCWWWALVVRERWYSLSPPALGSASAFLFRAPKIIHGCGELRKREHVILTGRAAPSRYPLPVRRSRLPRGGSGYASLAGIRRWTPSPSRRPCRRARRGVVAAPWRRIWCSEFRSSEKSHARINMVTKHFAQGEFLPLLPRAWPLLLLSSSHAATPPCLSVHIRRRPRPERVRRR